MATGVQLTLDKNVPVPVRDGTVLRADVFRPSEPGRYPVIMTSGPYGKDIHFADFNAHAYSLIGERGQFLNWETVNPEWWVPHGYVVVRVDERGTGASPGRMALFAPQEHEDFYDAIEWAGTQEWSTGRVGLLGVSYYAMGQWHVAALRPPHLAAIVVWEGAVDLYRDFSHHGGILSNTFPDAWWPRQITGNQHALQGGPNPGVAVAGNADLPAEFREHALLDGYFEERTPDLSRIDVPLLSAGNWSGYALHLRGNVEGYLAAGTDRKWLEVHSGNHFAPFYSEHSRRYQKRFLDRWLRDDVDAWDEAPLRLFIRTSTGGAFRDEQEWPLARTQWTRLHLDAAAGALSAEEVDAGEVSYPAPDGGTVFTTAPFASDTEVTGPMALHLQVSATTSDMDLFVTVLNIGPDGREVVFEDASGQPGPVVKGWLRVSHRALDAAATTPWRPVHPHTSREPLVPGEPVAVVVEILPTSMIFERGHRLGLAIEAHDRDEPSRFLHNDEQDRPRAELTGTNTLHTGGPAGCYLLVPVIPAG